jgi:hypothetical protein
LGVGVTGNVIQWLVVVVVDGDDAQKEKKDGEMMLLEVVDDAGEGNRF